ncbi:DUF3386 domain-containing protein [Waterburya agarophytonicola K14]|uniref:DUF3386 domain-containing protein n=1 Tax=Waterburya agarophytonicola KI4 TaxID=2874699 RepID=A0A964BTE7_9CYAN|nr:DUF3386 domain-containing protein [Waterburya agarophytonicola]MCC0177515.1 DUF3386 domain-containing protein [Waterburya agarophytonicola KI4]
MSDNTARDRFRAAYENRYTWDSDFPGYTTKLELKQGEEIYTADIKVNSDLTVEVTGIEDEKVAESVYNHMRDVITHRKRNTFENAHGKSTFTMGESDASGAVEILVQGDSMGSNYKIRGTEICQVSRVMGPMAFVINTNESLDTGEGYISTGYNAIFRDSKTNDLKTKREFDESYEKFDKYYVPKHQTIEAIYPEGGKITTEFIFSETKLLEPAAVA